MSSAMTVRRMKTHTAETGYVYQYYFVGNRPALPGATGNPATEYVFDVSSDRKTTYAVSIFIGELAAQQWAESHGRPLNDAERYAAAKLALLRTFDTVEDLLAGSRRVMVSGKDIEEMLTPLLG
ncbi:MAG TPA: hypothetical protein VG892_01345 [Terriglobales bacterium]|nr:hypothetical protein [Terriglobales bacterium]